MTPAQLADIQKYELFRASREFWWLIDAAICLEVVAAAILVWWLFICVRFVGETTKHTGPLLTAVVRLLNAKADSLNQTSDRPTSDFAQSSDDKYKPKP